ncbi:hypothetical protein ACFLZL_00940 [Thermodesulfobacteriota bacterium]
MLSVTNFRLLVAWMLTADDGGSDGRLTDYLSKPEKWLHYDPELFYGLNKLLAPENDRGVYLIEETNLLPNTKYFSEILPDSKDARYEWREKLYQTAKKADFVFFDPDNGLQVKSKPFGRKGSSKYLYWGELEFLWGMEKSVLIYQHFPRIKRDKFIQTMLERLQDQTKGSLVSAFSTPYVLFLFAWQPEHSQYHLPVIDRVKNTWAGPIKHWGLSDGFLTQN